MAGRFYTHKRKKKEWKVNTACEDSGGGEKLGLAGGGTQKPGWSQSGDEWKERQQWRETLAAISGEPNSPRRPKRPAVISQYPFNHCNTSKFPLSAVPPHIIMSGQYAILQCGEELVSGGQVIIQQLLAQENCCARCISFTVSHKIKAILV